MKNNKKRKPSATRTLVTLCIMVVVAVGYFTTIGIGNVSAIGIDAYSLICPLGFLEGLLAAHTFIPRALISFVLVVVLVVVFGRVFCAWICPMPMFQRWFPGIAGKRAKAEKTKPAKPDVPQASENVRVGDAGASGAQPADAESSDATRVTVTVEDKVARARADVSSGTPNRFRFDSRYGVLLGALASAAIFGFPVFCLICPVGLTFATVLLVMRLFAFGDVTWAVIAAPAVLLIEVLFLRKWCSRICPLGAVMSLISGANKTFRPTIDDAACQYTSKGVKCLACAKACPEGIDIRRPSLSETSLNNCTKCHECTHACPTKAISFPFLAKEDAVVEDEGR